VQHCLLCQQAKTRSSSPVAMLQPFPIPNLIWEDVVMDFITGLPNSLGYLVIMVIVDRLSKYAHFSALKTIQSSQKVAEVFMLHICPNPYSDRDKVFASSSVLAR